MTLDRFASATALRPRPDRAGVELMSAASAKASKVHKIIALNEVGALKEVGPILGLVLVGSPKPIARPRRSAWASSIVAGWLRTTLAVRIDASVAHA